jgi:hypothetical protein
VKGKWRIHLEMSKDLGKGIKDAEKAITVKSGQMTNCVLAS